MAANIFDHEELMITVLNQLADRAHWESVALVLLTARLSVAESQAVIDFIAEEQVKQQPLSQQACADQVLKIKPDIENALVFVQRLKRAATAEGRFPDVLNA